MPIRGRALAGIQTLCRARHAAARPDSRAGRRRWPARMLRSNKITILPVSAAFLIKINGQVVRPIIDL
jgi:hypothetical protein